MAEKENAGEPLDKVLSKLDSLATRMDALETGAGRKNPIKGDAEGEGEKKPGEGEGEGEKKPDAKKDGEGEGEGEGEKKPPFVPADKKPDAKKDGEGEGEAKVPPVAADKRKDAEAEEERKREDAAAKADSAALRAMVESQAQTIRRLEAVIKPRSDEEHAAYADAQARADAVFQAFGKTAPRPLEGENLITYRKRLATHLKPYSNTWKGIKMSSLGDEAFAVAETQVYSDAAEAARHPTDLAEGELREVNKVDRRTGLHTTEFYGESYVKGLSRPGRRVRGFRLTQSA